MALPPTQFLGYGELQARSAVLGMMNATGAVAEAITLQSRCDARSRGASTDSMQVGMKKEVGKNGELQIQRLLLKNDADPGQSHPAIGPGHLIGHEPDRHEARALQDPPAPEQGTQDPDDQ